MATQQLLDYIKERLAAGVGREQIESALISQGWKTADIEEGLALALGGSVPSVASASLPSVGALFGEAWALFTKRLGTLLAIAAIPALLGLAASAGSAYLTMSGSSTNPFGGLNTSATPFFIAGFVVGILVVVALSLWSQVALIYAIKDADEGIGFAEAFKRGRKQILSYFWISLLGGFIMLGGFFLLVIPGILFMVWFSLSVFVLVAEQEKGMRALLKSRAYVQGRWWAVFGRLLAVIAAGFVVGFVVGFVGSFIPFGRFVGNLAVPLFVTPFVLSYLFLLYKHLRAARGEVAFAPTGGQKTTFIIIGIAGLLVIPLSLSSVVFTGLTSARFKAQEARQHADLKSLQVYLELYRDEQGSYPPSLDALVPRYMPSTPANYRYLAQNGTSYELCPSLIPSAAEECVSSPQ